MWKLFLLAVIYRLYDEYTERQRDIEYRNEEIEVYMEYVIRKIHEEEL